MKQVGELIGKHAGEDAWLFGKGPSLDAFDFEDAGALRICINESIKIVPDPTYFFAHDEGPIHNVADTWTKGCCAVLQDVRAQLAARLGIEEDSIYVYDKQLGNEWLLEASPDKMADLNSLYGNSGTVHSAIHFCKLIGVGNCHLVGFDGGGGYAQILGKVKAGGNHGTIRRDAVKLLETIGLKYSFFSLEGNNDDGDVVGE